MLGFTPLHEAAQKGRTQLCSLLLAHGADPRARNQEGQSPLDVASSEDVKCLLQDAMPPVNPSLPIPTVNVLVQTAEVLSTPSTPLEAVCSPASLTESLSETSSDSSDPRGKGSPSTGDGCYNVLKEKSKEIARRQARNLLHQERDKPLAEMSVPLFLKSIGLESLNDLFVQEHVRNLECFGCLFGVTDLIVSDYS